MSAISFLSMFNDSDYKKCTGMLIFILGGGKIFQHNIFLKSCKLKAL